MTSPMAMHTLRPVERRVLELSEKGMDDVEIAWRFRRSPRFVKQIKELADLPRSGDRQGHRGDDTLRPIERRVLFWRQQGFDFDDMAPRFRRGSDFLRQVETLAHYKLRNT